METRTTRTKPGLEDDRERDDRDDDNEDHKDKDRDDRDKDRTGTVRKWQGNNGMKTTRTTAQTARTERMGKIRTRQQGGR
jgi:hypothetical protein